MLVARRSAEKQVASNISSLGLTWIQQAIALPFIILSLFFARFYLPGELSQKFWFTMGLYVVLISIHIFCYFKAISLADISYLAPLMTLTAVGNIVGAYFVLGQVPTVYGMTGAILIVTGAAIAYSAKRHDSHDIRRTNRLAVLFILITVTVQAFNASIEVTMLRESNPTTFNFYSSLMTIPFILLMTFIIIGTNRSDKYKDYWKKLGTQVNNHKMLLLIIGITYTVNMLATYQAKLIGPNAGYVGAIKSASVLPMMLIGALFFKEKIVGTQWAGLAVILVGLLLLSMN